MDAYLKRCIEGTELIIETEQYSLYIDEENNIHIYSVNDADICEISLNNLGKLLWE